MKNFPHKKILVVTTNYSGENNQIIKDTGVWLEEFAVPYLVFKSVNYDITVASPKGGISPVDEQSMSCSNPEEWDECIKILRNTEKLSEVDYKNYDGLFLSGGHGPMFDLANDILLKGIVEYFFNSNKLIAAICHGVAGLVSARRTDGESILKSVKITSFTNKEEKIMRLDTAVPFLLESKLRELGAEFEEGLPWHEHVCVDKNIITGQNPQSSLKIAEMILENWSSVE